MQQKIGIYCKNISWYHWDPILSQLYFIKPHEDGRQGKIHKIRFLLVCAEISTTAQSKKYEYTFGIKPQDIYLGINSATQEPLDFQLLRLQNVSHLHVQHLHSIAT